MAITNDTLYQIEKSVTSTIRLVLQDSNLDMATGIVHGDVSTAKIMYTNNTLGDLTVDVSTWAEIGNGFYTLEINSSFLGTIGEVTILVIASGCVPTIRHLLIVEETASDRVDTVTSAVSNVDSDISTLSGDVTDIGLDVTSVKGTTEDTNTDVGTLSNTVSALNDLSTTDISSAITTARLASQSLANKILESSVYNERLLLGLLIGNLEIDSDNNQMVITLDASKIEQGNEVLDITTFDLTDADGDPTNEYPYKRDIVTANALATRYGAKLWSSQPTSGSYHTFNVSTEWGVFGEHSWGEDTILIKAYYYQAGVASTSPAGISLLNADSIDGASVPIYVPVSEIYDGVLFMVTKTDPVEDLNSAFSSFSYSYYALESPSVVHTIVAGSSTDITIDTWSASE